MRKGDKEKSANIDKINPRTAYGNEIAYFSPSPRSDTSTLHGSEINMSLSLIYIYLSVLVYSVYITDIISVDMCLYMKKSPYYVASLLGFCF
jgi:hypothetical protein